MNLYTQIHEDFKSQREGILSQGFWALLIYRISHPRIYCQIRFFRIPWRLVNVVLLKVVEIFTGISLAESAKIGRRLCIEHFGSIIIHGSVVIGDDCLIRQGVTIGNRGLDDPFSAPTLGNRVDVGAGAKLIGGILIGDDVKIGANAVVVTNIPSNSVVVGIPAKVIGRCIK